MNRRDFLKGLAGTAAAVAIAPYVDPETLLPVQRVWPGWIPTGYPDLAKVDFKVGPAPPFRERRFSEPWGHGIIVEFDLEAPYQAPTGIWPSPLPLRGRFAIPPAVA